MMNVYQKLQKCRVELKTLPIKESGNNKFAGYTYMELGDFLPHIVDLCDKHQLCTVVSFGSEATLTVFNSENPEEQITFASPMSTAELKGCHQIQNLGAVETYLRRYLYVSAFDIVEHDALDSTQGAPEQKQQGQQKQQQKPQQQKPAQQSQGQQPTKEPATQEQIAKIHDLMSALMDRDGGTQADILKTISHFVQNEKEYFLTPETLAKNCSKGWAGKIIGKAEGMLKA